jgi:hypothetical protein
MTSADVLTQAEDLPELDIGGAEALQPAAQLHREGQVAQAAVEERPGERVENAEEEEPEAAPPRGAPPLLDVHRQRAEDEPEQMPLCRQEAPEEALPGQT